MTRTAGEASRPLAAKVCHPRQGYASAANGRRCAVFLPLQVVELGDRTEYDEVMDANAKLPTGPGTGDGPAEGDLNALARELGVSLESLRNFAAISDLRNAHRFTEETGLKALRDMKLPASKKL